MDLTIIIVNYNVKYFLEQCLYSVEKACVNISAEIFVVDNASSDGSYNFCKGRFPNVRFIWNDLNTGFAKANNSVLSVASGDYILFLNPDTIIAEDTLEICLAFASQQTAFGALGVSMVDGSGNFLPESKRMYPSTKSSFYKTTGLAKLFPDSPEFSGYYATHIKPDQTGEVEILAGAFMMVSKKVISLTKGFDEEFFMYGEDIDLSYRILKAGFKNFYCGFTNIIHFKGESIQKEGKSYLKNFYGAMLLFIKKHRGNVSPFVKAGIIAAYTLSRLKRRLSFLLRQSPGLAVHSSAIAASENEFDESLQLLKYAPIPFLIKGRIAVNPGDDEINLGYLTGLKTLAKKNHLTHILFAQGDLSFKRIIETIIENRNMLTYLIHAKGSSSIVGSPRKHKTGSFITAANFHEGM